ncbi:SDR family oxidoreductase [Legionella pneumophila]
MPGSSLTASSISRTIEDIGETTSFLVSDKAASITGQIIYVDAGYNIKG